MKIFKNSISMKTLVLAVFALTMTAYVNAQFVVPNPSSPITQVPTEDVRTTNSITYDLDNGSHIAGEQYRWEVRGGTITSGGSVTTVGDASVVDFTVDAHTITVQWDSVPASAIVLYSANIQVQKISVDGCYGQIQTLPINIWNLPTYEITDADVEICSGDATAGNITVELEGAPALAGDGFTVSWEYDAPDVEDGSGSVDGQTGTVTTNGSSLQIPLPANLINTVNDADRTFTVNITLMQDSFNDQDGALVDGSYVITVHPVLETGDIESSASLVRR